MKKHPDRFAGMASVNPWFDQTALEELRRCLDAGLVGIMVHPLYQGVRLSDPVIHPLIEIASEYKVPVYAHTGTAGIAEPLQLVELALIFPEVQFIMGHSGASDYYSDALRALELAENIWLETSRNGPGNYGLFKTKNCLNRVVFGSSAPEYIPAVEIEVFCDIITDASIRASVFYESAKKIFKRGLPV